MTTLHDVQVLGQSIWNDNIRRAMLTSGELQRLLDDGVVGVTSNPTIFEKAIAGSGDYDDELRTLANEGRDIDEIYEALVLADIAAAADLLRPIHDRTNGRDGYISLEVRPTLAHDTDGTIAEARRLFSTLGRKNVMIKVPATREGIPAIEALIAEGMNVNVTLIFSLAQYEAVAEAYLSGLEKRTASGSALHEVASVASFFVSRVDAAVDQQLEALGETQLMGRIAIANFKHAYARFGEIFSSPRWEKLAAQGARVQRPLWASTGTKNPLYPDTLYVDSLIGPDTVNTVPPATLQAFIDHGRVAPTLEAGLDEARADLTRLSELGVDLAAITQKLQDDGVSAFAQSFVALMGSISEKRQRLLAERELYAAHLGAYQQGVDDALRDINEDRVMTRIWNYDHTVWKPDPTEITNRLGWLHAADGMMENVQRLQALAEAVRAVGYTDALLLGMGGSSLAPEVFRKTFGVKDGYLDLAVLDSTDPAAVLAQAKRLDPARTLFIVSTKSGGTVETLSFFKFFYNWVADAIGANRAGEHFVAITDPGTKLVDLAETYRFRTTFLNDPNIGGRYSALTYFGLVPAALIGVDVSELLDRALAASSNCDSCVQPTQNSGAWLGAIMGGLAKSGRDKLTLVTSPELDSFGDWVEQLVAESTGKDGNGILPVVGEPLGSPDVYGSDRLFVYLRLDGSDGANDGAVRALEAAGHPVVWLHLRDTYDLGAQFFLWEMATAVAGSRLGINPFDQPNVESAKVRAREMVAAYQETGTLPEDEPASLSTRTLKGFLDGAQPGDYIAIQAYVTPTGATDAALQDLRRMLRDRYHLPVTAGYGPRFLHSTGQLHKGDAGQGLFIQLMADAPQDVPIPDTAGSSDASITFGVLKMAQSLGDKQALSDVDRRVIRFHLGNDVVGGLRALVQNG